MSFPWPITLAFEIAAQGISFIESISNGKDYRKARSRLHHLLPKYYFNVPLPINPLEHALITCDKFFDMNRVLSGSRKEYASLFMPLRNEIFSPLANKTATVAFDLLHKGKEKTFLYFFFVGLTILAYNREIAYCNCCHWRLVNAPTQNRCCSVCHPIHNENGKPSISTLKRIQKKKFEALRNTTEFRDFANVKHFGEDYLFQLATGFVPNPGNPLDCDPNDFTADKGYRSLKIALAKRWDEYQPKRNYSTRKTNDERLIELAQNGYSKSKAADKLKISRAAVTKACNRNPKLAKAFEIAAKKII